MPQPSLWPLLAYAALILCVTAAMIAASYLLGPRGRRGSADPFESGVKPTGTTGIRITAGFYLVALSFLIFDLEAAFIFAWAVAARELGLRGYLGLVIFIGILLVILAYEWKRGFLDWGPQTRERRHAQPSGAPK